MANVADSKSAGSNPLGVQVPSPAGFKLYSDFLEYIGFVQFIWQIHQTSRIDQEKPELVEGYIKKRNGKRN